MTSINRRGRSGGRRRTVRTVLAAGAATLACATVPACEKPTPMATVTVGAETVATEAVCYNDGKKLSGTSLEACQDKKAEKSITVSRGDIVRLGVEPEMADPGWVLYVNGRPAISDPIDKTYRSLTGDGFFSVQSRNGQGDPPDEAELTIAEQAESGAIYGVWRVTLELDR